MITHEQKPLTQQEAILGCVLGAAVGDAMGLPMEGLNRDRIGKFHPDIKKPCLAFGKGMFSDDTEHTLMVLNNIIRHKGNVQDFTRGLAWSLKWWFLAFPAGVGLSTARAIIKLWGGFKPNNAGVFSAGNGAAMRSPIIGAFFYNDPEKRRAFTDRSARLTHTDPRALEAAHMAAAAAALACNRTATPHILKTLILEIKSQDLRARFKTLVEYLDQNQPVQAFADAIGCKSRVSGYAPNTIATAIYAWLRHRGNYREIVTACIRCGGDTDTVAAIAGGIAGGECGETGIPKEWITNLSDWPRSVTYIRTLAIAAGENHSKPPHLIWPLIPFRNVFFLLIVLTHGFRRLLPPY